LRPPNRSLRTLWAPGDELVDVRHRARADRHLDLAALHLFVVRERLDGHREALEPLPVLLLRHELQHRVPRQIEIRRRRARAEAETRGEYSRALLDAHRAYTSGSGSVVGSSARGSAGRRVAPKRCAHSGRRQYRRIAHAPQQPAPSSRGCRSRHWSYKQAGSLSSYARRTTDRISFVSASSSRVRRAESRDSRYTPFISCSF
jgi:hypothetical protein